MTPHPRIVSRALAACGAPPARVATDRAGRTVAVVAEYRLPRLLHALEVAGMAGQPFDSAFGDAHVRVTA